MLREGTHIHCFQYRCQRSSMKSGLHFLYHRFEVSVREQARIWGLTQTMISAKVSTEVIRSWIWNSPSSSPCWVMAFLKTVQGSSVVPILSSQTMALKPGPHGNIQVFCLFKSHNHERHIDCSCAHRGKAPGSWKHSPRTMRGVSGGPCLLHDTRPWWVSSNLPKICSHIQ